MEPSTLLQNIEWKYSEIKEWQSVEVPTAKLQDFFGPILSKNINISNAHNFGNTGLISKIPTLLSSEAQDLSPYKISWILVRVRWKIPILLDHLTWNDPVANTRVLRCFRNPMLGLKIRSLESEKISREISGRIMQSILALIIWNLVGNFSGPYRSIPGT